jgi:hypothetical protein
LLPKKDAAADIADFHPISLIHGFAKIFSKAIACRIAPHLDSLIAVNQSAFIQGRSIQDNYEYISQSVKTFHLRRALALFLKLDIAGGFDSVSWLLLLQVLRHCGFGLEMISRIICLLASASTRFLINGSPGGRT